VFRAGVSKNVPTPAEPVQQNTPTTRPTDAEGGGGAGGMAIIRGLANAARYAADFSGSLISDIGSSAVGRELAASIPYYNAGRNVAFNNPGLSPLTESPGKKWVLRRHLGSAEHLPRMGAQELTNGYYALFAPMAWVHSQTNEVRDAGYAYTGDQLSLAQLGDRTFMNTKRQVYFEDLSDMREAGVIDYEFAKSDFVITMTPLGNAIKQLYAGNYGSAVLALGVDVASIATGAYAGRLAAGTAQITTRGAKIAQGAKAGAAAGAAGGFVTGTGQTLVNGGTTVEAAVNGVYVGAAGAIFGSLLGAAHGLGAKLAPKRNAVIGRMDNLQAPGALRENEYTIASMLADLGSPKANYYNNMSVLRRIMRQRVPIRDASSAKPDSAPAPTPQHPTRTVRQTFTGAERNLLRNRGWVLSGEWWNPPK
jgi:hypothetical protein